MATLAQIAHQREQIGINQRHALNIHDGNRKTSRDKLLRQRLRFGKRVRARTRAARQRNLGLHQTGAKLNKRLPPRQNPQEKTTLREIFMAQSCWLTRTPPPAPAGF